MITVWNAKKKLNISKIVHQNSFFVFDPIFNMKY